MKDEGASSPQIFQLRLVVLFLIFCAQPTQCDPITLRQVPSGAGPVCVGDTVCYICAVPADWCAAGLFVALSLPLRSSSTPAPTSCVPAPTGGIACRLCVLVADDMDGSTAVCNASCGARGNPGVSITSTLYVQGKPPAPRNIVISNMSSYLFAISWSPPTNIHYNITQTLLTVTNMSSRAVVRQLWLKSTGTQYQLSLYDLGWDGCSPVNNLSATVTMACNSSIGNESSAVPFPPTTQEYCLASVSVQPPSTQTTGTTESGYTNGTVTSSKEEVVVAVVVVVVMVVVMVVALIWHRSKVKTCCRRTQIKESVQEMSSDNWQPTVHDFIFVPAQVFQASGTTSQPPSLVVAPLSHIKDQPRTYVSRVGEEAQQTSDPPQPPQHGPSLSPMSSSVTYDINSGCLSNGLKSFQGYMDSSVC